jgi:Flp pilus assembly protein TadG
MIRNLIRDRTAATTVEFAIVLPLLLIFLLGMIDAGRWMWEFNKAEKATQMGARFAVVADPVSPGIDSSYIGTSGLTQGDLIPASDFGQITCTGSGTAGSVTASCSCTTDPCPALGTADGTAFQNIVDRMKLFLPELNYSNVTIRYSSSGLGYAGNPNGADISPLITVTLSGVQFTPITSFLLTTIPLPASTTSLTAEDLSGTKSN